MSLIRFLDELDDRVGLVLETRMVDVDTAADPVAVAFFAQHLVEVRVRIVVGFGEELVDL